MNVNDEYSIDGFWWLPGSEEPRVHGLVEYDVFEGGTLRLSDVLHADLEVVDKFFGELPKVDAIWGRDVNGRSFSLFDVSKHVSSHGFYEDQIRVTYNFETLLLGGHFESIDAIMVCRFQFRAVNLERWMGPSPNRHEWIQDETVRARINVPHSTEHQFDVGSGKFVIWDDYRIRRDGAMTSITRLAYSAYEPSEPLNLEEAHTSYYKNIKFFLSLCMGETIRAFEFVAEIVGTDDESGKSRRVRVFRADPARPRRPVKDDYLTTLIPFPIVKQDLGNYIQSWLTDLEKKRPVYVIFFRHVFDIDLITENAFFNAIQSVESYFRITRELKRKLTNDEEDLISVVEASVPETHLEKVLERIAYSSQKSLREKLIELFEFVREAAGFHEETIVQRSKSISEMRSKYAHSGRTGPIEELYGNYKLLYWLLILVLLKDVGVDDGKLRTILSHRNDWQSFKREFLNLR